MYQTMARPWWALTGFCQKLSTALVLQVERALRAIVGRLFASEPARLCAH